MYFTAGRVVWVSLSGFLAEHSIRPAFCKYIILSFTWLMFCFKVKWWQTTYYWKEAFKLEVIHHGYIWPFTEGHKAKCFYSVINAAALQNRVSDGTDASCPDLLEALSHNGFLLPWIRLLVCRCISNVTLWIQCPTPDWLNNIWTPGKPKWLYMFNSADACELYY